jgi:hypothetical protein
MPCVRPPCQSGILRGSTASHVSSTERRDIEPADHAEELERAAACARPRRDFGLNCGGSGRRFGRGSTGGPVVLVSRRPLVCDREEGDLTQR